MNKYTISATLGYTVCTFALAVLWHIVLFEMHYKNFGYIEAEPNFILGFSSILLQGILLSWFYHLLRSRTQLQALTYVSAMGFFFWTSHVLAFVAKQSVNDAHLFVAMETLYLALQFGVYGLLLQWLYRKQV